MGSHKRRECGLGAPPPKSSQKDSGSVGWYLRVTHSDARATVTHVHMLDRRTVGMIHPPHSACCSVTGVLIQLDMVTKSVLGFVGTFFECRSMEPQTKMPLISVCPLFDLGRCSVPEREQQVGSKVTWCALFPSCGLAPAAM